MSDTFDRSILQDGFLGWLRFANAGMLDDGNVVAMDYAIRHMPMNSAVVEIGCFCGLSTNVLTAIRRRHQRTDPFFATDPWMFEGADKADVPLGDGGITFGEYRQLVKNSFETNVLAFSRNDKPHAMEMDSDTFFEAWGQHNTVVDVFGRSATLGGPIGFCYIDGDHSYGQARRDFDHTARHLSAGGFILFDDSADGSGWEVCRVVAEIAALPQFELIGRFPNYLFRKL